MKLINIRQLCLSTKKILILWTWILLSIFINSSAFSATYINNTAVAEYELGTLKKTTNSNLVKANVCSRAKIELLKYAPNGNNAAQLVFTKTYYLDSAGNEYELSEPVPVGSKTGLSAGTAISLAKSEIFHGGEPIFIKLTDDDHNVDPAKQDEIVLSLKVLNKKDAVYDEETIKFFEIDVNSGVFVGFIQSSKSAPIKKNGVLSVEEESKIVVSYSDKCGPDDTATVVTVIQAASLVDPFGKIFDSSNGNPLNGVKVTLIDATTNLPAIVYGDDGVSIFPSTVLTGSTITDSSGVNYVFPEGEYRFPLIPAGNYILKVDPPEGYKWPSIVSDDRLVSLPNGPFTITTGSRGETFNVPMSSIPIKIDIPLDPNNSTPLFVTKSANKDFASWGEFIKYKVTIENVSNFDVTGVKVNDFMPLGFKYQKGSTKVNGLSASDPNISPDGRALEFVLGSLASNGKAEITYVAEVGVGARLGPAKNIANAKGDGGITSNTAKAEVIVKDDFMQSKSFIIGKVMVGCEIKEPEPEIKIEKEEVIDKVELKGRLISELKSTLNKKDNGYEIDYNFSIEADLPIKDVRAVVTLPDGLVYKKGSSKYREKAIEPDSDGAILKFKLGDLTAGEKTSLKFATELNQKTKEGNLDTKAHVIFNNESDIELKSDVMGISYKLIGNKEVSSIPPILIRPKFESGSAILTEDDKLKLDNLIEQLKGYKIKSIEVIGHTDNQRIGKKISNIYPDNYALSKARAESVANYLGRFVDLSSATLKTVGKGEEEPLVPNSDLYNMALNRRVEINISAEKVTEIKNIAPVGETSLKKIKEFTVTKTEKREVLKEIVKKPAKRYKELPKFGDGLAGVKIYMEDGTYVITDQNGMYHFEGVKPGTHVLQIDKKTVPENYEIILYEDNTRFARTPYSRFVDLQGGTLWRADFYVCPKPVKEPLEEEKIAEVKKDSPKKVTKVLNGVVRAELLSSISENMNGKEISYKLPLETAELPVKNVRVSIILPKGIVYKKGSSRFGEKELEPEVIENSLSYSLRNLPTNSKSELIFGGEIVKNILEDEMITRALVVFDTDAEKNLKTEMLDTIYKLNSKAETTTIPPILIRPKFESGSAILTEEDKLKLDDLITQLKGYKIKRIEVIGHTDNQRINGKLKNIYPDNYALSKARAESVANYLNRFLDLYAANVVTIGKGEDEPLVSNSSAFNMSLNRRVELNIVAEKMNESLRIEPVKERSGVNEKTFTITEDGNLTVQNQKETKGFTEKNKSDKKEFPKVEEPKSIDDLTQYWIDRQRPGFEFIFPKDGYYPPLPSLNIAVKYFPTSKIKLLLNGKEVEGIFLDSTKKSSSLLSAVTSWAGVPIIEGDNILEAVEFDATGKETSRIKKVVHYSGPPVKAEVVYEKSKLIADGKSPLIIAIKLLDKDGHPAREGVVGEYKVLPPHLPLKTVTDFQLDPLTKSNNEMSKYLVKEDGLAFIELNPTSQTGEAILKLHLVSGEKEVKVWIKPEKRDWILVGLAEGTLGFNSTSGSKLNLAGSGLGDSFSRDGRVAFFAKGMLGDEWLLTLSYDSDRIGSRSNNKLFNTIDPAKYYTLYGDTSQQQYEAQSSKPLYVKLERDKYYALFGDFQTNLNAAELARYNRSITGFKSELKGDKYEFNIFLADTNQAYVKDELRGDGTSGLYKLSAKNIVVNSEKITLETRDRFKSEIKISTKQLARFIDYNIDYDTGTIFFKSPITPFDENLNPIYIVVEYEVFDSSKTVLNYGGRGAIKLWDKKLEIGASYIHEEAIGKKGDLFGVDIKANITEKTTIKAELAGTNVDTGTNNLTALAYLAELSHTSDKLKGKIYFRELEKDFGLGQQSASESGTRKMGVMGSYSLTQNLELGTDLMRQYNLNDDTKRDLAELKTTYRDKRYDLTLGLRHAQDTLANGDTFASEQLMAGGAVRLLDDKLTLKVQRDQSVGGNKNADFPTRTMLGADYKLNDKVMLFASHEMLDGKTVETDISRIGMKSTPWQGGQINSTIEQQHTENGTRVFSVMGLQQTWQVNEKWSLSAGLDRSDTIKKASYTLNGNTFSAGSEGDYTAVNLGAGFKEKLWGWNGRVEYRDGKEQDKAGLFSSIYGEIKEGIGLGSALQLFDTKTHTTEQVFADLRFGLVYRPKLSKWTLLERLDIILDSLRGGENAYDSLRFVNIANLNYKDSKKWQFSIQYGAKYVTESIDEKDYSGFTDLIGFEGRYDIKNNWDMGFRAKLLHSWNASQYKYSFGPTVGYTPKKNIWISLGYNLTGFTDRDFSKADYTAHGIFFNFRLKFDQESAKNSIRWLIGSPAN